MHRGFVRKHKVGSRIHSSFEYTGVLQYVRLERADSECIAGHCRNQGPTPPCLSIRFALTVTWHRDPWLGTALPIVILSSVDTNQGNSKRNRNWNTERTDAPIRRAGFRLEKTLSAMSGQLAPVASNEFVVPIPRLGARDSEATRRSTDSSRSLKSDHGRNELRQTPVRNAWRHTIGIILLLATVVLWTASNFLASVSCSRVGMRIAR